MADLEARHELKGYYWKKGLPAEPFVLGRLPDDRNWATEWEPFISRKHATLHFKNDMLHVQKLSSAVNPIFHNDESVDEFYVYPNESFRIGNTVFTLRLEDHPEYKTEETMWQAQTLARAGGLTIPDYLAPEQVDQSLGKVTWHTDLHAVGVFMFQALIGRLPLPEGELDKLRAIASRRFHSAVESCGSSSDILLLAKAIDWCLSGGFQTIHEFREAIHNAALVAPLPTAQPVPTSRREGVSRWLHSLAGAVAPVSPGSNSVTGAVLRGLANAVAPASPNPKPPEPIQQGSKPNRGESFRVVGLLFEDTVTEAYEAFGVLSNAHVTMRLFKPGYDTAQFINLVQALSSDRFSFNDETPQTVLLRFHAGRARPLPVIAGTQLEFDPDLRMPGALGLVEEYAGKNTLMHILEGEELVGDVRRIVAITEQVLSALAFSHVRGCVHGSLTPHCVFVDSKDKVKVEGFGMHSQVEELRMKSGGDSQSFSSFAR